LDSDGSLIYVSNGPVRDGEPTIQANGGVYVRLHDTTIGRCSAPRGLATVVVRADPRAPNGMPLEVATCAG